MRGCWWLFVLVVVSACLEPSSETCSSYTCADGTQCRTLTLFDSSTGVFCIPDELIGCADGEACDARGQPGICRTDACVAVGCGNRFTDPGESCEDGNNVAGDGCAADCTSNEQCGNGVTDTISGEQCDDGQFGLSNDGCTSTCGLEVARWQDVTPPAIGPLYGHRIAYDGVTERPLLFGGANITLSDTTWAYDGTAWITVPTARTPLGRSWHAMVRDKGRNRIVMFGGFGSGVVLGDTWEWDGRNWIEMHPATSPSARAYAAIAYDTVRGKVVLFGGQDVTAQYNDTWEYDGATWTKRTPAVSPPVGSVVAQSVAIYDEERQQVVLLHHGETWLWDGTNWTKASPSTPASTYPDTSVAYDEENKEVVVYDDYKTWRWNGTNWSTYTTSFPDSQHAVAMTWDPKSQRIIGYGGSTGNSVFSVQDTTWLWNGAPRAWGTLASDRTLPEARGFALYAYDAKLDKVVLFSGVKGNNGGLLGDTWTWTQGNWTFQRTLTSPAPRAFTTSTYDSKRGVIVMLGGGASALLNDLGGRFNDVWELGDVGGGTLNWTSKTTGPSSRRGAMGAFDVNAGKSVFFGGSSDLNAFLDETWTWDGTTWMLQSPATKPPARELAAMAYDPIRKRVVLFGGMNSHTTFNVLDDTWEWDGTTWTQMNPATKPGARALAVMVYNPDRKRIVLYSGGGRSGSLADDPWEWNGTDWTQIPVLDDPGGRGMGVYEDTEHRLLVFGGQTYNNAINDTWALSIRDPFKPIETCLLLDVDDDGDGLMGCADPDCWPQPSCSMCPPGATCP